MTTYIYGEVRCPNCNAVLPYHNHPCNGGSWPMPTYQPQPISEERMRRIIREELDKRGPKP